MKITFSEQVGIKHPIICGAMYPCSNPELIAAASNAGGIGIVQPISLSFVHGHKDYRKGLKYLKTLTDKPIGFNALIEKSSKIYEDRMKQWVDISIEEGILFFITALGNPKWVVDKVHAVNGIVYHDITNLKWALKAQEANVDGFICVNNRAGGHAGTETPEKLFHDLKDLGKPLICAGGIGSGSEVKKALDLGYAGVQLGTRFIATKECKAHDDYKNAIIEAGEKDIVLTDKISGVSVSIINTPYIKSIGTKAGPIAKMLLKGRKTKHWMRMYYTLVSVWKLKKASLQGSGYQQYWQAGKSVETIKKIESVEEVMKNLTSEL